MKNPIILVAGGTGGHVFPALSLAQELEAQGHDILFFTDSRGARLIPSTVATPLKILPLQGRCNLFIFYLSLVWCFISGLGDIIRYRPQGIVGFGGYPALTWGLLAGLFRIPLIIHEQNAILGRTNRLLVHWTKSVALTFKMEKTDFSGIHTGIPLRRDFKSVDYALPKRREVFHLFVVGGSQGARIFGEIIPQAVQLLPVFLQERLDIVQQCCAEDVEKIKKAYGKTAAKTLVSPFFSHVAELLENAHLVIARAGASTIAEVMTVGRPALFIPFPGAQDDHQTANAQAAVMAGGGWLFNQKILTAERVASFLERGLTCPSILLLAAEGARRESHQDATQKLSKLVLECFAH